MFVYALIAAELGLLYVVFWYLYLRDAKKAKRFAATNWGRYQNSPLSVEEILPADSRAASADCQYCGCSETEHAVKGYMVPHPTELVFDRNKNRFISARKYYQTKLSFASLLQKIDEKLSHLNVRP